MFFSYILLYKTPLLQALKVKKIDNILQVQQISLLRNALLNKSKARTFYLHMFKYGTLHTDKNLISRCIGICNAYRVSLTRYVFDEHYANKCKRQVHDVSQGGVVDSIRSLLHNYNNSNINNNNSNDDIIIIIIIMIIIFI